MNDQTALQKFGLIVISAPSGTGKSTLCSELLKKLPTKLALSISTTSRAPRGTEVHGKEYFFTTQSEFETKIKQGEFAEWAKVHENYYGTSIQTLKNFWAQKRHVLLDIDVQGAQSLRTAFPDRCFTVFIAPPSMEELERRLRGRGTDSEAVIQKRMRNAEAELAEKDKFNMIIVNDVIESAYQKLEKTVLQFMDQLESGLWQK